MKKLFLFVSAVALTMSLNSCSDDGDGGNSVSFKVGGVTKSFKVESERTGSNVTVHGYRGTADNPIETVTFSFQVEDTDPDPINSFTYVTEGRTYIAGTFESSAASNTTSAARGTFAGQVESFTTAGDLFLTEGKFSVKY